MSKVFNTGLFLKEYAKHVAAVYAGTLLVYEVQDGIPTRGDLIAIGCLAAGFPITAPLIGIVEVYNYLNPEDEYVFKLEYSNKKD
jgi:hypothetical protein